jgi:ADP-ribose pyrophosphatase
MAGNRNPMDSAYQTISSRIAYENHWTRLREDKFRRPDGSDGLYGVVERADFVIIVPWQDGNLTLVQQYRYPVRTRVWEFPMGMWEQKTEFEATTLAAAELREETGLIAGRMLRVGVIFQGPGYCTQRGHVFLATELTQGPAEREMTEQDMICREVPLAAFEAMVRDGTMQDGMTIAAFGLLRLKGLL